MRSLILTLLLAIGLPAQLKLDFGLAIENPSYGRVYAMGGPGGPYLLVSSWSYIQHTNPAPVFPGLTWEIAALAYAGGPPPLPCAANVSLVLRGGPERQWWLNQITWRAPLPAVGLQYLVPNPPIPLTPGTGPTYWFFGTDGQHTCGRNWAMTPYIGMVMLRARFTS